jgi:cytochrome c553
MRIRAFTLGLALGLMALAAHADGDAAKGKVESYTCIGCHGIPNYTNNYPTYRVPKLAGQQAAYIVQALKEYKAGDRAHNTMHAQASSLSDQQMQDIAAYFESLGHAPSGQ